MTKSRSQFLQNEKSVLIKTIILRIVHLQAYVGLLDPMEEYIVQEEHSSYSRYKSRFYINENWSF